MLATILVLSSCSTAPAEPDPYERYRPAMRPEFQSHLDLLGPVPEYAISVTVEADLSKLQGTVTVRVPNNSPDIWNELIFRLYPNIDHFEDPPTFEDIMIVQSVAVNDVQSSFVYRAENTAIAVLLESPLLPREMIDVQLTWRLDIPSWIDTSAAYHLFGRSQDMMSLPLFYPSLAVYEPEKSFGQGAWWLEIGTVRGDSAFNFTSLFEVTATLPSNQVPVASGTLITSTFVSESHSRHVWVTGPSREFLLHTSPLFDSESIESYGTRITSFWLPGDEAAGKAALNHGVAALRIYSDNYGDYPFKDMRIAPAPLSFRGMEYPQVNLLGVEVYNRYRGSLESLLAHEVAHQWWYQLVHNDPIKIPWLDESLAEYSIKLYVENLYGPGSAEQLEAERWQRRVDTLPSPNILMNGAVMDYESGAIYEAVVYSKGALFYDRLFAIVGHDRVKELLRRYFERNRYQIVTEENWLDELRVLNDENALRLYEEYIGGAGSAIGN